MTDDVLVTYVNRPRSTPLSNDNQQRASPFPRPAPSRTDDRRTKIYGGYVVALKVGEHTQVVSDLNRAELMLNHVAAGDSSRHFRACVYQ